MKQKQAFFLYYFTRTCLTASYEFIVLRIYYKTKKDSVSFGYSESTQLTPHCVARAEFIVTVTTDGVEEVETRYSYDNWCLEKYY